MQCGVGILLRVHHPAEDVHHLHQTLHFVAIGGDNGIVIREVEQHQTVKVNVGVDEGEAVTLRDIQPIEQCLSALAKYCGARTVEINLEPSQGSIFFDERRYGLAGEEVPKWVAELLAPL